VTSLLYSIHTTQSINLEFHSVLNIKNTRAVSHLGASNRKYSGAVNRRLNEAVAAGRAGASELVTQWTRHRWRVHCRVFFTFV